MLAIMFINKCSRKAFVSSAGFKMPIHTHTVLGRY